MLCVWQEEVKNEHVGKQGRETSKWFPVVGKSGRSPVYDREVMSAMSDDNRKEEEWFFLLMSAILQQVRRRRKN